MTIEPYFPIAPHEKGLWIGPFTKAFFLDHVWVFNEIARLRLTGTIEFYQTPDNETGVDHKLALGFSQSHKNTDFFLMRTPFTTGPKWETATVETFRREYDCLGAVEFKDGNQEPYYVLLGVVADEIDDLDWETDIDEDFYYYMTQSEFDGYKTLVGVQLDANTYIREFDSSEPPEIMTGEIIR